MPSAKKEKINLENLVINQIVDMSKVTTEQLLPEYIMLISQRLEKNLQLIAFFRKLDLYPKICRDLQSVTKFHPDRIKSISKIFHVMPTDPKSIIELDHTIFELFCPSKNNGEKVIALDLKKNGQVDDSKEMKALKEKIEIQERMIETLKSLLANKGHE